MKFTNDRCIVCNAPVDLAEAHQETGIDPAQIAQGVYRKSEIIICAAPRCQRLLRETLEEEGRREVKQ